MGGVPPVKVLKDLAALRPRRSWSAPRACATAPALRPHCGTREMIVLRTLLLIVGLLSWSAAQAHHSDFLAGHVNDGLTIDACDSAGNTRTNSGNVFLYVLLTKLAS